MQNIHFDENFKGDKEISKAVEGIGTPATRGSIIKSLFDKGYVESKGKSLVKNMTSKAGKKYKVKYFLNGVKVEQEFYNK